MTVIRQHKVKVESPRRRVRVTFPNGMQVTYDLMPDESSDSFVDNYGNESASFYFYTEAKA